MHECSKRDVDIDAVYDIVTVLQARRRVRDWVDGKRRYDDYERE